MKNWLLRLAAAICLSAASTASAGTSRIEVRWSELPPIILGHTVSMALPTGVAVSGDVVAMHDDSLTLEIRKTSDARLQQKGEASIPRASITTLEMTESNRTGGRIVGVVVGAVLGMVGGAEIAIHSSASNTEGGAVGTFSAVAVAGAFGGYFAGKSVDHHTTLIRVNKE